MMKYSCWQSKSIQETLSVAKVTLAKLCRYIGQNGSYCSQVQKNLSLYYVVQHREGWHDEADVVSVVSAWRAGENPLWKVIFPSELKPGAEEAHNGLEEKISCI